MAPGGFLAEGGFPALTNVTAEHLREWLNHLRERGNKPATVNTRYRAANGFFKWLGHPHEDDRARALRYRPACLGAVQPAHRG